MQNAAFGRGLIILATVFVFVSSGYAENIRKRDKADEANSQHYSSRLPAFGAIGFPIVLTEGPSIGEDKKKEPDWSNPNCASPADHDEADLCEQRKSTALNRAQVALGVLGFIALIITVGLTSISTRAAVNAAKAALRSAEIAHAIEAPHIVFWSDVQVIRADDCTRSFCGVPDSAQIIVSGTNIGRNSAILSRQAMGFSLGGFPKNPTFNDVSSFPKASILPTGKNINHIVNIEFDDESMTLIVESRKRFYVFGFIEYADVFGATFVKPYCFYGTVDAAKERFDFFVSEAVEHVPTSLPENETV